MRTIFTAPTSQPSNPDEKHGITQADAEKSLCQKIKECFFFFYKNLRGKIITASQTFPLETIQGRSKADFLEHLAGPGVYAMFFSFCLEILNTL